MYKKYAPVLAVLVLMVFTIMPILSITVDKISGMYQDFESSDSFKTGKYKEIKFIRYIIDEEIKSNENSNNTWLV